MVVSLGGCVERRRRIAFRELEEELAFFSYDGLTLLRDDLAASSVERGSWGGCVLSYKRGAPGSTRRDRLGRARNPFTELWDQGWLTDQEVIDAVAREIDRRRPAPSGSVPSATPARAAVPPHHG